MVRLIGWALLPGAIAMGGVAGLVMWVRYAGAGA